jgi:hypothetical protein
MQVLLLGHPAWDLKLDLLWGRGNGGLWVVSLVARKSPGSFYSFGHAQGNRPSAVPMERMLLGDFNGGHSLEARGINIYVYVRYG